MLAGRVDGVAFESVGELELKGFRPDGGFLGAVDSVGGGVARAGRWSLPAVLRSVPPVAYVG